ncbi:hypothetical protein [Clostridium sp. UBA2485]|uniref:hypothetical protein n=1 Tax=Clostridium sp. UBA2485 TaxID=1946352 RepID=UPI0025C42840|nr:hypothetical protein [Clostridium sp. UBA2485]
MERGVKMNIKKLKELIKNFNDEDNVKIEIKKTLFDCSAHDDEFERLTGTPTLVISLD